MAIVEAGFITVAKGGSENFTTRRVADIAGVGVGTLYEYFANKEEILTAMNEQFGRDVVEMIKPLIPELIRERPRDAVLRLQYEFRDLLRRDNDRYLHCAQWLGRQFPASEVEPVRQALGELAMQYLSQNPQYTRLPDIPVNAYIIIHSGIACMTQQLTDPNSPVSFEELAEGLADMVQFMIEGGLRKAESEDNVQ